MWFKLATGKSKHISAEFIAEVLSISLAEAAKRSECYDAYLRQKEQNSELSHICTGVNITPEYLQALIVKAAKDCQTPVYSSYDYGDEIKESEKRHAQCLSELEKIFYRAFQDYFDQTMKPSVKALNAYLDPVEIKYVGSGEGTPLIRQSYYSQILQRNIFNLDHLKLNFSCKSNKEYTLVKMSSANDDGRKPGRNEFCVKVENGKLHYSVIDPKNNLIIDPIISVADFRKKFGQSVGKDFEVALKSDDIVTSLSGSYLKQILTITSERGHTQKKIFFDDIVDKFNVLGVKIFRGTGNQLIIPWVIVPEMNKALEKLGYDLSAAPQVASVEKQDLQVPSVFQPLFTKIEQPSQQKSILESIFKSNSLENPPQYDLLLNYFFLLNYFPDNLKNKLSVSDSLSIINITQIKFPDSIEFETIEKMAKVLKQVGLVCEAKKDKFFPDSLEINLSVTALEAWLKNKASAAQLLPSSLELKY